MKIATAIALAELAREPVPQHVQDIYGRTLEFGTDYVVPTPFDNRLITTIPPLVAKTAMETGVARKQITDFDAYKRELLAIYERE